MKLTLVVTKNCDTCKRAEEQMKKLVARKENVDYSIVNINDYKRKGIVIVPALLVDDELFAYGDIDENKLFARFK